jgi:hypothetical protein
MTTSATRFLPAAEIAIDIAEGERQTLTDETHREVERLTESLFFDKTGLCRRSIVMADIGGGRTSSLWLAVGAASTLGKALGLVVRVLSVSGNGSVAELQAPSESTSLDVAAGHCIVERVGESSLSDDNPNSLSSRLSALRAVGCVVIVHMNCLEERVDIPVRTSPIDGVVLLVRAGHTRRAALEAVEKRLAIARLPLLGSVLLDRVHPIPEKLYRLL